MLFAFELQLPRAELSLQAIEVPARFHAALNPAGKGNSTDALDPPLL
jgi:hypothetical protein